VKKGLKLLDFGVAWQYLLARVLRAQEEGTTMARGRKSPYVMFLSPVERVELEHWQRSTTIQAGLAKRAKIILWRADGLPLSAIARRLAMGRRIVRQWLQRFMNTRIAGLEDQRGRGRQPILSPRRRRASGQTGL
jgi:hypothetical protein